ncbi:MAG: transglutaminase-like domain-containing protein [Candidatus Woesearchaeota archaeon]
MVFGKKGLLSLCALLCFAILCSPLISASETSDPAMPVDPDTIFSLDSMVLNLEMKSNISIIPTQDSFYANSVKAELFWLPLDDFRQTVLSISTQPPAYTMPGSVIFEWKEPEQKILEFRLTADVETRSDFLKVKKKIGFPITNISPDLSFYLEPQEIIDITPKIESLARELSEGKNDLYAVVFAFADWVHNNVAYSMGTLTADATQKSSWVLRNRYGVCDEITSLFISLNRAAGIPARFVSGYAFTNLESINDWGPHGWAEVYFPGTGWVPFDVTYSQLGYVDAAHIKLSSSFDAQAETARYTYNGRNFDISASKIRNSIKAESFGEQRKQNIDASLDILYEKTGFGSFNLVTATLENKEGNYLTAFLRLANTTRISVLGNRSMNILFRPFEEKKVYWIIQSDRDLDRDYIYTFPIVLYTDSNTSVSADFKAQDRAGFFTKTSIDEFLRRMKQDDTKPLSMFIDTKCSAENNRIYQEDAAFITCEVNNTAKVRVADVELCFDGECSLETLDARSSKTVFYVKRFSTIGPRNLLFTLESNDISKTDYLLLFVLDKPKTDITARYPARIGYEDNVEINFIVDKLSLSLPRNATVRLEHDNFHEEWVLGDIDCRHELSLLVPGSLFNWADNEVIITVDYRDEKGNIYADQKVLLLKMNKASFFQRVFLVLNKWSDSVERLLGI